MCLCENPAKESKHTPPFSLDLSHCETKPCARPEEATGQVHNARPLPTRAREGLALTKPKDWPRPELGGHELPVIC